jgi:membrane-associated phospholipid phosphatase
LLGYDCKFLAQEPQATSIGPGEEVALASSSRQVMLESSIDPGWSIDSVKCDHPIEGISLLSLSQPRVSLSGVRRRSLWALTALLAIGWAFGSVAATANRTEPNVLDDRVSAWLVEHRTDWPAVTRLAHGVTRVGNPEVAVPLVGLAALTLLVLHRRGVAGIGKGEAVFWVAVPLGGNLLDGVHKGWYQRERPPLALRLVAETTYSFPSGHSLFAAILFGLTAVLIARLLREAPARKRAAAVALVLTPAVLIAASRVWLGVHYPTDVLGGLLLGSACLIAACLLRFGWPRRTLD